MRRDVKGLHAKANAGRSTGIPGGPDANANARRITGTTGRAGTAGAGDPYEPAEAPRLRLRTAATARRNAWWACSVSFARTPRPARAGGPGRLGQMR
ncbi:hypothetical protein YW7DRAFT_03797 [Streptomyces sp. AmelKG-E11A]|nr:hypothetical protein YW7DRAFT_03797 [Streptomyces sp. AmelKG-E11A]